MSSDSKEAVIYSAELSGAEEQAIDFFLVVFSFCGRGLYLRGVAAMKVEL